jgi:hypothetical protein
MDSAVNEITLMHYLATEALPYTVVYHPDSLPIVSALPVKVSARRYFVCGAVMHIGLLISGFIFVSQVLLVAPFVLTSYHILVFAVAFIMFTCIY